MKGFIGAWAFIVGLIVAIIIAILGAETVPAWSFYLLALLGLIVGFLNVTEKQVMPFLLASIAFLVTFQSLASIVERLPLGEMLSAFFGLITVFIGPAAAVVAVKELFAVTKSR